MVAFSPAFVQVILVCVGLQLNHHDFQTREIAHNSLLNHNLVHYRDYGNLYFIFNKYPEVKRRLRIIYVTRLWSGINISPLVPIDMIINYEKEFDEYKWSTRNNGLIRKRFKTVEEYRVVVDKWFAEYQWPFEECWCECYRQHLWPKYFYSSCQLTQDLILRDFDKNEINNLLLEGHITFYRFLYNYQTMRCDVHILPDMCFWFYDPPIRSSLYFLGLNWEQPGFIFGIMGLGNKEKE
jgi:hypothetical protein